MELRIWFEAKKLDSKHFFNRMAINAGNLAISILKDLEDSLQTTSVQKQLTKRKKRTDYQRAEEKISYCYTIRNLVSKRENRRVHFFMPAKITQQRACIMRQKLKR